MAPPVTGKVHCRFKQTNFVSFKRFFEISLVVLLLSSVTQSSEIVGQITSSNNDVQTEKRGHFGSVLGYDGESQESAFRKRRVDPFVEFYTKVSATDVDKQNLKKIYNEVISKLRLSQEMERSENNGGTPKDTISVMDRLYSAVNHGHLPDKELQDSGAPDNVESFWSLVNKDVSPVGSFLEIGDCVTSFQIAADHPNITVVALTMSEDHLKFCGENAEGGGLLNYNLAYIKPSDLSPLIEDLYSNPQVLFETIFISNLTELSSDLLPHELEELLARVFSLSRQVLIINYHKGETSKLSFFASQWTSPGELIEKSCQLGGLGCSIIKPFVGDLWKNNERMYRVNVKQGARDMPDRVCINITQLPDCVLLFSSESGKVVIQSGSRKIHSMLTNSSTVLLSVLLQMNPVELTREKLFNQILDLPYPLLGKPFGRELAPALRGSRIIWSQLTRYDKVKPTIEKTRFFSRADNILSQEEGVARTWERVEQLDSKEEELKTLDSNWQRERVEQLDSKEEELKNLDSNWQREVPAGKIDKEKFASIEIDKVWSREKDLKQDMEGPNSNGEELISNWEVPSKNSALTLNDEESDLTNDEKELQKAIGFLYGRSETTNKILIKATDRPSNSLKFEKKDEKLNLPNVQEVQQNSPGKVLNISVVLNRIIPPDTMAGVQVDKVSNQIPSELKVVQKMDQNSVKNKKNKTAEKNEARQVKLKQKRVKAKTVQRRRYQQAPKRPRQRHLLSMPETYLSSFEQHRARLQSMRSGANNSSSAKTIAAVSNIKVQDSEVTVSETLGTKIKEKSSAQSLLKPHAFSYRRGDHQWYDHYWRILHPIFRKEADLGDADFNLLTFGGEAQSLIGLKVATRFPFSTVVTVMSRTSQPVLSNYRQAMKTLTRKNCLLLVNDMTSNVLDDLYHLPELFRFQVLGVEIFLALVSLNQSFLYYFGQWLTLSRTTILEVPDPQLLLLAYSALQPFGRQGGQPIPIIKGFVEAALRLVGAQASNIEILAGPHHHGYRPTNQRRLLRIDIDSLNRQVYPSCSDQQTELQVRPGGLAFLNQVTRNGDTALTPIGRASSGVGLEFLLTIGPSSKERKLLFENYLKLPIYEDMCPTHLVYFNESLLYHPVTSPSQLYTINQELKSHHVQSLLEMLSPEIGPQPFSFMEYNSREGALISSLTFKYKNSTFISLQKEISLAEKLYKDVKGENLDNLVISQMDISRVFTKKLVKSPDFLRYQFISIEEFLDLIKTTSRDELSHLLGEILASSVTTFIQVPSDKMFSLAMSTFFPEAYTGVPTSTSGAKQKAIHFMRDSHPLPVYKGSELKFIKESAKADLNVTISAEVISPDSTSPIEGTTQSWKLIRADVRNLSVQVDHHFDYSLDGHSRKYQQHCISHNKTSYEVFLIREQDGFKIPYGNVYAISLIALLRMGLLPAIKADFYDKFLKLPLYEDMAPWNIVFQAGQLDYIDYDSKDVTFDKMVPAAYQILAMLMNYERTIKDFGHCGDHASNEYQFKLISNCVGGSGFSGPCKDSRYPVPCGDHTCRSTFIECLQVLNELEKIKGTALTALKADLGGLSSEGRSHEAVSEADLTHGIWSFNSKGVIKMT